MHRHESAETRWVERFRQGDAAAMDALFNLFVDDAYSYARSFLGCREDAEEVASEAFVRAFRRAEEYRGDGRFGRWLMAIVRNLCRDRLRQPRLLTVAATEIEAPNPSSTVATRCDVRRALDQLSPEHRDILVLCDVEQWDAAEVADMLDTSAAAVRSMLYRARAALRILLADMWKEP